MYQCNTWASSRGNLTFVHVNNKYAYQTAHVVRLSPSLFACFTHIPCADPESFVRGGPALTTFFLVYEGSGGSKYHYKRAIIGPPAIQMAFRWRAEDGLILDAW